MRDMSNRRRGRAWRFYPDRTAAGDGDPRHPCRGCGSQACRRTDQAKVAAAQTDISNLSSALDAYEIDNGSFPTSEQGLNALVENPGGLTTWKHSYISKLPKADPWGQPYIYRCPGNNGKDYDLVSGGPDKHEGGDDDITNH